MRRSTWRLDYLRTFQQTANDSFDNRQHPRLGRGDDIEHLDGD